MAVILTIRFNGQLWCDDGIFVKYFVKATVLSLRLLREFIKRLRHSSLPVSRMI